jgi:hypothetical protein
MEQAVEDGGRQDLVAKHGAPLGHDLIGGNQQAAGLVAAAQTAVPQRGRSSGRAIRSKMSGGEYARSRLQVLLEAHRFFLSREL